MDVEGFLGVLWADGDFDGLAVDSGNCWSLCIGACFGVLNRERQADDVH
jgi:hypothetical protein